MIIRQLSFVQIGILVLAVTASALMLVLALPLGEQSYLGWFIFVPLLRVVRGKGFLVGLAVSLSSIFLAAWLSVQGWFYTAHDPNGSSAWVYTGFGIFGFSVCMAIGAWGDKGAEKFSSWWFAALAVVLEAYLLVQLPAHLALTQYRNAAVLQLASVGGVWLVSFLVWWSNFVLAKMPLKQLIAAVCVIAPVSIVLSRVHFSTSGKTALVGVVQLAEPEEDKLTGLQRKISKGNPDFVVWPEFGGIPFVRLGDPARLAALSGRKGIAPILTSYPDDHQPLAHNVSTLFANGNASALYFKRRLFGEESKMHFPGDKPFAADFPKGRIGLNICFDSCYPEIIRDTARLPGVNLISLPSDDPNATNNFIAAMHASYSPFRCAEEGVSMVMSDGLAYSMFIDPYGQILSELGQGDQTALHEVPLETRWTLYKALGDWFLYLCGLLVVVPMAREIWAGWKRKHRGSMES